MLLRSKRAIHPSNGLTLRVLSIIVGSVSAPAQDVKIYISSRAGDQLTPKGPLQFEPWGELRKLTFRTNQAKMHQAIVGFGASLPEAGVISLTVRRGDMRPACIPLSSSDLHSSPVQGGYDVPFQFEYFELVARLGEIFL